MSIFRKSICGGDNIPPACCYCAFGEPAADPRMVLCEKRGVVAPNFHCRRYQYDPLQRVPKRQPKLPNFSPEDFSLD